MKRIPFFLFLVIAPCRADLAVWEDGKKNETTNLLEKNLFEKYARNGNFETLTNQVLAYYAQTDYAVVHVNHVEKNIFVTRGYYDRIAVVGTSPRVNQAIAKQVKNLSGKIITKSATKKKLAWIHRNPYHLVAPDFAMGGTDGAVDSVWNVKQTKLWDAAFSYANNGSYPLPQERITFDFSIADLDSNSSVFSLRLMSAFDPQEFFAAQLQTQHFLPWGHELQTAIAWSESNSEHLCTCGALENINGFSDMFSIKYIVPLEDVSWGKQNTFLSSTFRRTNNALDQGVTDVSGLVDSFTISAGYNFTQESAKHKSRFISELIFSPGNINTHNEQDDFEKYRKGADESFSILRVSASHVASLPKKCSVAIRGTAQYTSNTLLPNDEMSLGGMNAVRSEAENHLLCDRGIIGNVELSAPEWMPMKQMTMRNFIFADAGYGYDSANEKNKTTEALGLGCHIKISQNQEIYATQAWSFDSSQQFNISAKWSF